MHSMEFLHTIVLYIQNLTKKEVRYYTLGILGGLCGILAMMLLYINSTNQDLITRIKQLYVLSGKVERIIEENNKMIADEQHFKDLLDKDKNFTIQGFFEQFCREQTITTERWDVHETSVNENFDERILSATIKDLTTQRLVQILDALDKKEIIYIKELSIHNDNSGKISCTLSIATKTYKAVVE